MTLTELMEGLRKAAAANTRYCGIQLTRDEIPPILREYDEMRERLEQGGA